MNIQDTLKQQEFLKAALGSSAYRVQKLPGDGSDRSYFRIVQSSKSFILMQFTESFASFTSFLNVQKYFEQSKIAVPILKFYRKDLGMILLEDLGDNTLEHVFLKDKNSPSILALYQQAIDELIKIHHHKKPGHLHCVAFDVIFDAQKLTDEMLYCQKHLLEDYCQISLTEKVKGALNKEFMHLCSLLDLDQRVMIHRDYHSRNLMIKLDKVCVIDFQDARMSSCQYDLVSLLKDAYVNIDKRMEDLLIDDYLLKSRQLGFCISKDEFMQLYYLYSIQRCFKMCGSFAGFYNMKKDSGYLKYISKSLQNVLNSLSYFPECQTLKSILIDHNLINRDYQAR